MVTSDWQQATMPTVHIQEDRFLSQSARASAILSGIILTRLLLLAWGDGEPITHALASIKVIAQPFGFFTLL